MDVRSQEQSPVGRPPLRVGALESIELLHLAQALTAASSLLELGRRFRSLFSPLFAVPMYGVYLIDPWSGRPELVTSANVSACFLRTYEEQGRDVDTLHSHLVRTQQPAYNIGLMSMAEWLEHPLYRRVKRLHDVRQEIQTPVTTRHGIVGNINFGTSDARRGFTPAEVRLAEALGKVVGTAVDRIHHSESVERERDLATAALDMLGSAVVVSEAGQDPRPNAAARALLDSVVDAEVQLHRVTARVGGQTRFSRHLDVDLVDGDRAVLHGHSTSSGHDVPALVTVLELQHDGVAISEQTLVALTPREREIALRVVDGLTDNEIAGALHLSSHTVRQHVKAIYRKLDVDSRVLLTRMLVGRPE